MFSVVVSLFFSVVDLLLVKDCFVLFLMIVRFITATLCDKTRHPKSEKRWTFSVALLISRPGVPYHLLRPLPMSVFLTSLNEWCIACLPGISPQEDLTTFVEWVLVNNGSTFTICPEEDVTIPTPDPEPTQTPSPLFSLHRANARGHCRQSTCRNVQARQED